MGAPKLHVTDSLRAEYDDVIAALVRLGNKLDDHGLPSMTVDHIRLEVVAMKVRAMRANDNQSWNNNGTHR